MNRSTRHFWEADDDRGVTPAQIKRAARTVAIYLPLAIALFFTLRSVLNVWDEAHLRVGDRRYEVISVGGYLYMQRVRVATDGPRWAVYSERVARRRIWEYQLGFSPTKELAGFAIGTTSYEQGYQRWPAPLGDRESVRVPYYGPLAVLLLPYLVRWRGVLGRRIRPAKGVCSNCGYDLQGMKLGDRCPECGTTATARK